MGLAACCLLLAERSLWINSRDVSDILIAGTGPSLNKIPWTALLSLQKWTQKASKGLWILWVKVQDAKKTQVKWPPSTLPWCAASQFRPQLLQPSTFPPIKAAAGGLPHKHQGHNTPLRHRGGEHISLDQGFEVVICLWSMAWDPSRPHGSIALNGKYSADCWYIDLVPWEVLRKVVFWERASAMWLKGKTARPLSLLQTLTLDQDHQHPPTTLSLRTNDVKNLAPWSHQDTRWILVYSWYSLV